MVEKPKRQGWASLEDRLLIRTRTLFFDVLLTKEPRSNKKNYSYELIKMRYTAEEEAALRLFTKQFMASVKPKAAYVWGSSNRLLLPDIEDWGKQHGCYVALARHPSAVSGVVSHLDASLGVCMDGGVCIEVNIQRVSFAERPVSPRRDRPGYGRMPEPPRHLRHIQPVQHIPDHRWKDAAAPPPPPPPP